MGICITSDKIAGRIDIRFIPYESYFPAILYFTGSGEFNRIMRKEANDKGALTGIIVCNNISKLDFIDHIISVIVGPEVVTGSTTAAGSGQTDKDLKKNKVKTGSVVKNNLKKGAKVAGKVAGTAARIGGRVFLPLAAVMGIFDAAKGVAETGDLLDKEEGDDLSFRDKASAGFAGF